MKLVSQYAFAGAMAAGVTLLATPVLAQDYPTKTIHIVAPYAPGGSVDFIARTIGQRLSKLWGQQVVIDNKPGGAGSIGVETVISAAPDGYTLLMGTNGELAVSPILYDSVKYDAVKNLAPITMVASNPFVIAAGANAPFKDLRDLIKQAKERPGTISYASAGNGSMNHLTGAWFASAAGINLVHIPYKGAGPAAVGVASGEVPIGFLSPASVMPHIASGKVRPLGITTKERPAFAKGWDTAAESGVTDFDADAWIGLLAPAGTPGPIIAKINAAVREILNDKDLSEQLAKSGLVPAGMDAADFATAIRQDSEQFKKLIPQAGIKAE